MKKLILSDAVKQPSDHCGKEAGRTVSGFLRTRGPWWVFSFRFQAAEKHQKTFQRDLKFGFHWMSTVCLKMGGGRWRGEIKLHYQQQNESTFSLFLNLKVKISFVFFPYWFSKEHLNTGNLFFHYWLKTFDSMDFNQFSISSRQGWMHTGISWRLLVGGLTQLLSESESLAGLPR